VRRLVSSPAIQFKGTGWYITDYAQKGKSGKTDTPPADKPAEGKTDSAAKTEGAAKSDAPAKPAASSTTTGGSKD
jgi:hypothetical protein